MQNISAGVVGKIFIDWIVGLCKYFLNDVAVGVICWANVDKIRVEGISNILRGLNGSAFLGIPCRMSHQKRVCLC